MAEKTDSDVSFEADEDSAVDGAHDGDVGHGEYHVSHQNLEGWTEAGHTVQLFLAQHVGKAVGQRAANDHNQVVDGQTNQQLMKQ